MKQDLLKPEVVDAGDAQPLGMRWSLDEQTLNFAIVAPDAETVFVHFFLPDTEEYVDKVEISHRTGKVFHARLANIESTWLYAIQAIQKDPLRGAVINDKLLLDPYAKNLNRSLIWDPVKYKDDSPFFLPKAKLNEASFDWQGATKPTIAKSETILYETHVKGFTQLQSQLPAELRGTYLGLAEPISIDYLKSLGVTSVQLMPVFSFMSEPRLQELGLVNYWGYNPISFFAPDSRYAIKDAVFEFKTMVRELHKAGIEVILDVVYNHTAEGGKDGPVLSYKGLVEAEFYVRGADDYSFEYANYTGCGNTVNADSDFGLRVIMDSLRYWLEEMQVDGFRFDLAATLGRNGERFNHRATLLRAMAQDPVISQAKLIAEPWDIGPEGYQLGNFPPNWVECNDRYRDSVRKFWRGDRALVPELASRILGSRDIFKKGRRSQISSVNYVAYHDGYTLHDLVSYEQRHNLANLEDNRDGHGANYSRNYGVEGPTSDPNITKIRERQKRNMLATLFLSQGIPHLLAGDEFGRTQQGNNNAYCQDNEVSWVNWQLEPEQVQLSRFVKKLIEIRKAHPVLQHCILHDDGFEHHTRHHHVAWLRPDGEEKSVDDWQDPDNQCLGLLVADEDREYQLLFILNASECPHQYVLPTSSSRVRLLDTKVEGQFEEMIYSEPTYIQQPQSISLWKLSLH
ncbi:glycogen debranching protein GlgX [Psychrosphaera ytuae]|uniref:Glycogen debranching protein GlgX n=1 Tax=Psychrosphaera ytuae TaxID=2820710 RepID=A0A975HKJ3_9GAMM|nr:glycogen debranching protein GlgX [Psychrosphaera ytuae]QTH64379.1 glycogen debranching protein GlgX [Psychrosphaera ytuae]